MKIVEPPDNVVEFPGETSLDTPVDRVLDHAADDDLDLVLVIGEGNGGALFFECSSPDGPTALWLLERAKQHLLKHAGWDEE